MMTGGWKKERGELHAGARGGGGGGGGLAGRSKCNEGPSNQ